MDNSFNPTVEFSIEERAPKFPWLNAALFATTCCTTLVMGTLLMADFNQTLGDDLGAALLQIVRNPSILLTGLPFSVAIMTILFAHEMGHYLTCRYYGIAASLPYFIPMTIPPVGTMGAFIRIRSPIQHRSALLDVGVAGPIAGFVFAVPALVIAMMKSPFVHQNPTGLGLGAPLIFKIVALVMGKTLPSGLAGLHPIGFAA